MKNVLLTQLKKPLYITCLFAGMSAFAQVPVALDASDILGTSCHANWEEFAGATGYRLDVSTQPDFNEGLPTPWINEFRYNVEQYGVTGEEFFEVVVPNNYEGATDLKVSLYDADGNVYHTSYSNEWTTGINAPAGHTIKYMVYDLQIFGPTFKGGIALSHTKNGVEQLIQFVSYGGTITAVSGPAAGKDSQGTPGASLSNQSTQMEGMGGRQLEFEWAVNTKSKGFRNNDQTIFPAQQYDAFVAPYNDYDCGPNLQMALNNLNANTTYYYRVRAVNGATLSGNSNVVMFRTLEPHIWANNTWTRNGMQVSPPTINDDVIIEDDFIFGAGGDGTFAARSIVLLTGSLNIQPGYNLHVRRGIANYMTENEFVVENNANIIQENADIANIGEITVKKNSSQLYRLDYTIWSSPVSGQTLGDFSPLTQQNRFYTYNTEISEFESVPTTEEFMAGRGYMIRMPDTWPVVPGYDQGTTAITYTGEFKGVLNNGNVIVNVNNTGAGYNMVGNPYPSPINIHAFFNQNILSLEPGTPIWVWRKRNNPDATSYATITKAGYTANYALGGDTSAGQFNSNYSEEWVLNPGQGFFVRVADEAEAILFTNNMREAVNNGQFFRNANTDTEPAAVSRLRLNIEGENEFHANQAVVAYSGETTLGIDPGWDGQMMTSGSVRLYTKVNDMKLVIQARPEFTVEDEVPLLVDIEVAGNYTISLDQMTGVFEGDQIVILEDTMTGIEHNLKDGGYTFTAGEGTYENRFILKYTTEALNVENPVAALNNIVVYKQGSTININAGDIEMSGVRVYDIRGRVLFENQAVNSTETAISSLASSQQVLLVQISSPANGTVTKKIIF